MSSILKSSFPLFHRFLISPFLLRARRNRAGGCDLPAVPMLLPARAAGTAGEEVTARGGLVLAALTCSCALCRGTWWEDFSC